MARDDQPPLLATRVGVAIAIAPNDQLNAVAAARDSIDHRHHRLDGVRPAPHLSGRGGRVFALIALAAPRPAMEVRT
jgi:hypothetical protein